MRRRQGHCDVDLLHWSRYLDGEYSSVKCRRCEAHLAGCAACRAKLRDIRRTVAVMKAAQRQPLPGVVTSTMRKKARAVIEGAKRGAGGSRKRVSAS